MKLDILLYPEIGMDQSNYQLAYSRLAPVQVATHGLLPPLMRASPHFASGHASTTGIPNIDYFVTYKPFEIETAQQHYTEKLVTFSDFSPYSKVRAAMCILLLDNG